MDISLFITKNNEIFFCGKLENLGMIKNLHYLLILFNKIIFTYE